MPLYETHRCRESSLPLFASAADMGAEPSVMKTRYLTRQKAVGVMVDETGRRLQG
jgi:hypothetical protein